VIFVSCPEKSLSCNTGKLRSIVEDTCNRLFEKSQKNGNIDILKPDEAITANSIDAKSHEAD
jgi:hypothetical protein